jgi:FemAB family protein
MQISKIITDYYSTNNFKLEFVNFNYNLENSNSKDDFTYYTIYSPSYNMYQSIYHFGELDDKKNFSFILLRDDKVIGLHILTISESDNTFKISSNGLSILPPLLSNNLTYKEQKQIFRDYVHLIKELKELLNCKKININTSNLNYENNYFWIGEWMKIGSNMNVSCHLWIDLTKGLEGIRSRFSKNTKWRINSSQKLWKIERMTSTNLNENNWGRFKKLHFDAAGRMTRNELSWSVQLDSIRNNTGVLVFLEDSNNEMVGGGFFEYSKDDIHYAVAAYDRNLFDLPLGYAVINEAIKFGIEKKIKRLYLGRRPYKCDFDFPSDKEINIGEFKEQFHNQMEVCVTLSLFTEN